MHSSLIKAKAVIDRCLEIRAEMNAVESHPQETK